jgi:hypothetical protein
MHAYIMVNYLSVMSTSYQALPMYQPKFEFTSTTHLRPARHPALSCPPKMHRVTCILHVSQPQLRSSRTTRLGVDASSNFDSNRSSNRKDSRTLFKHTHIYMCVCGFSAIVALPADCAAQVPCVGIVERPVFVFLHRFLLSRDNLPRELVPSRCPGGVRVVVAKDVERTS